MVQDPDSRVYRWNRAHLKPICHDGSSFQDHSVKKGKKQPKDNSFQDHQPSKVKSVSIENGTSYMDTRSMLFDEPNLHQAAPTPPTSSPPKALLTQITIMLTPSIISIQRIIHGAQLRGLLTQRQEETPVWTSFHQTPWHWQRTHTWTFSPVSWNFTIGTLQNTVAGQG